MGGPRHLRLVAEPAAAEGGARAAERAGRVPRGERPRAVRAARTFRVLLVEDNAHLETLYEHALARLGADGSGVDVATERAADGAAALARLARAPRVELVVTDLYMPTMDGFTLVERMRGDPAQVMTPVLAISAGGADARERALELGADAYLQKPVKIAALLDAVRALLRVK